ncbi:MAG TPA: hypothetical protein VIC28_10215 [Thermoanaerobaculia bacterium]|jgi:hypothetical protein
MRPDFQPADPGFADRVRASFARQGFMQQTVMRLARRPHGPAA